MKRQKVQLIVLLTTALVAVVAYSGIAAFFGNLPGASSQSKSPPQNQTTPQWLPPDSEAQPNSIYWGALVNGVAPSSAHLQPGGAFEAFERRVGKKMSLIHWGQPWKMKNQFQPFYAPWFDNVRQHGAIPLIDWSSWNLGDGPNQPGFRLEDISDGDYDAYIRQWASDAKKWGHPFFLRFDWEMNGTWQFPWSEQLNGNKPGEYIQAWRHVHDIFNRVGATNVTWVWCPNVASKTTVPFAEIYPGDAYVDWACLDGYNHANPWLSFDDIFAASYAELTKLALNKPIMIAEMASLEAGDDGARKAAWIADALGTQLPRAYPKVRAVVWFNWDDGIATNTFPIESSSAAVQAFATMIGWNTYAPNDFTQLDQSPIPPPGQ